MIFNIVQGWPKAYAKAHYPKKKLPLMKKATSSVKKSPEFYIYLLCT